MAVRPFKGLTARHIYMLFGTKGLNPVSRILLDGVHLWIFKMYARFYRIVDISETVWPNAVHRAACDLRQNEESCKFWYILQNLYSVHEPWTKMKLGVSYIVFSHHMSEIPFLLPCVLTKYVSVGILETNYLNVQMLPFLYPYWLHAAGSGWTHSFRMCPGYYLRSGKRPSFPHPFQFITHIFRWDIPIVFSNQ